MKYENIVKNSEEILQTMPWYVQEFYRSRNIDQSSRRTLYSYLHEYRRFFDWLIDSGLVNVTCYNEIPISVLEQLPKRDMEAFIVYLRERKHKNSPNSHKEGLAETTINRTKMALSSLFKYLTEESENESGEPYFYRNVMKKIKTKKQKDTLASRAANIKDKLFLGEKTKQFLDFISDDTTTESFYAKCDLATNGKARAAFEKNRERDLAIIALLLASGIRLSECVGSNIFDLNLASMTIDVTRKGNKRDTVNIAPFAKPYLEDYLSIRNLRYKTDDKQKALFVTTQSGTPARLGGAAIERLVAKYSEAFGVRVTPHKLRHTLATRVYEKTKSPILTASQLGHEGTQLVATYAHVLSTEQQDALSDL